MSQKAAYHTDKSTAETAAELPKTKQIISGAEAICICLLEEGVDTIFGYPGGAIMPFYDALYHYMDRLRHILPRHEQGGIHAAEGYSRVTRRTGIAIATSGPGATNLITGLGHSVGPRELALKQLPPAPDGTEGIAPDDITRRAGREQIAAARADFGGVGLGDAFVRRVWREGFINELGTRG